MRVAYVCADPGIPVWGSKGASAHVRAVVRALRRRGCDVTLFTPRTGATPPHDLADVPVVALPAVPPGPVAQRERAALAGNDALRALLEAHGPFAVVYERYSLWSSAGMAYASEHAGTGALLEVNAPLVEEQGRHRDLHDRAGAERVARRVLSLADGVVAVSQPVAAWTRSLGATRVAVLPNGVDAARFCTAEPAGGGAVAAPFTVAFVGSLKSWHGVEVLLAAAYQLSRDRTEAQTRLLIVGDGPRRDAIETLVDDLGLRGRTTMTGAVDPDDVPAWLACADVGVAPYPAGAGAYFSPLKVVEYLGAGLPVVASAVGQIPALLDGERAGLLTPAGDPAALAAALRRLRDDPVLRLRLGARGVHLARTRHSWDGVVDAALALLHPLQVVGSRGGWR